MKAIGQLDDIATAVFLVLGSFSFKILHIEFHLEVVEDALKRTIFEDGMSSWTANRFPTLSTFYISLLYFYTVYFFCSLHECLR